MKINVRFVLLFGILVACLTAGPAFAAVGDTQQTQTTAHYKVTLTLGPVAIMLMPDQAAGAKEGEVMVQMPGMTMPSMTMTDQGQQVNNHLEIALFDKTSGAVVTDQMPMITVKNDTTGVSRNLDSVMAMYNVQVGKSDMHFGNNVYLPDGTYTVTATVNGETATFSNVVVGASGSMSSGNSMPATGESLTATYAVVLAFGGLVLGTGLLLRRRSGRWHA